jgi:hypothetical protein
MFFNLANVANFSSSASGMSLARYSYILRALNSNTGQAPAPKPYPVCGSTSQYHLPSAPMSHNRELATAMALVCRICAEVAFTPGTTDIGLDDDLLRLSSRKVVLEGYSQIINPNKGLGVIRHGAVSNCTSLYCGGHVASRNESTLDCVKILLPSCQGHRLNHRFVSIEQSSSGIEAMGALKVMSTRSQWLRVLF